MSQREPSTTAGPAWAEELAHKLDEQRRRMRAAVEAQRELTHEWEASLQSRLSDIQDAVQTTLDETAQSDTETVAKLAQLEAEEKRIAAQMADLAKHRGELETLRQSIESAHQAQVARQQALIDDLARQLTQIHQREATLAQEQAAVAAAQAEVEALRRACDETEHYLKEQEESLRLRDAEVMRHAEASRQREEALKQRETSLRDRETTLQQREDSLLAREEALRQRDETLRQRDEALRDRNEALREAERAVHQREAELAQQAEQMKLREQHTRNQRTAIAHELRARRKEMLAEAERQRAEAVQAAAGDESALALQLADAKVELTKLRASEETQLQHYMALEEKFEQAKRELLEMHERLVAAESRPAEAGGGGESNAELEDLQRRLEMALSDVREFKQRNAELTEQLAKNRTTGTPVSVHTSGPMDWEARKQALLAQLESDYDDNDPQQKAEKLTIQEAIQRTEEMLAAKNDEIVELQRLLTEQSGNIGGVAIGAAAIAEMLDTDELIRQERESLRDMQEKLREQLRQAEIDISVERAKMARERAVLDEKMRQYEEFKQNNPNLPGDAADKSKKGGNRGRWLQRLGLKDEEEPS
jgi:hypothetical protein